MVKSSPSKKTDKAGSSEKTPSEHLDPGSRGNTNTEAEQPKGLVGFIGSTRQELEKVVWPTRQQLISESIGVLMIVLIFSSFIYLIDQGFSWLAQQLFT